MNLKNVILILTNKRLIFYSILFLFFSLFSSCFFELKENNGEEPFYSETDGMVLVHQEGNLNDENENDGPSRASVLEFCMSGNMDLCPDLEDSIEAIFDRTVQDYVFYLLGNYDGAPDWPPRPRRNLTVKEEKSNKLSASVGGDLSFMKIIKLGLKRAIDWTSSTQIELVLIKNTDDPTSLIQKTVNGKVYLNVDDGRAFIGQCNYYISTATSKRWEGSLKIIGTGLDTSAENSSSLSISASHNSNFFNIQDGDTTADLYLRCKQLYEKSLKQSLALELEMAVNSTTKIINSGVNNFQEIVDRSLYGPETYDSNGRLLKVDGYNFSTKPITWYRPAGVNGLDNSGKLKIEGQLTHHGTFFNHVINYHATIVNGNIIQKDPGISGTGDWKDAARSIVEAVINDAAIDFSAEFSELDPGQKEYVTFYEHSEFKGASIKLGVGQYANKYFKNIGWNSRISSIDVPPGFVVHLYCGDGLAEYDENLYPFDRKLTINAPLSLNSKFNDKINGVQIERVAGFRETYEIRNKFVSSNLGNLFKIAGETQWQIKHENGGYYKFMTKQKGVNKCLHYNNKFNLLLNTCMNTPQQLYLIQERIGTSEKGLYEIMTKKGYRQIGINKMALADGKQLILTSATAKGNNTQYWSFKEKPFMRKDLIAIKKKNTGSGKTEVHVLDHSTHYWSFKLQKATLLEETGNNFDFVSRDYNSDGHQDLIAIKKSSTGSGKTEIHILDGKSNYQSWLLQEPTALHETGNNFDFVSGDYNKDGYLDVIAIMKSGTGSGKTEVHVLDGKSKYHNFNHQVATPLGETSNNYNFVSADYNRNGYVDIIAIKKSSTGSGKTEVHILDGKNEYKSFLLHKATALQETGNEFDFISGDYNGDGYVDIVAIKKSSTGSEKIELHILNGKTKYTTFLYKSSTILDMDTNNIFQFVHNQ